eukprot:scaffold126493_cov22-Prasinocladus_malaysianus.AAC.1
MAVLETLLMQLREGPRAAARRISCADECCKPHPTGRHSGRDSGCRLPGSPAPCGQGRSHRSGARRSDAG